MALVKIIWCIICIDLVGTIVLVVCFALLALHTGLHLRSDAYAITNFTCRDFFADPNDLANDFVADAEGRGGKITPSACDGVYIGTTYSAAFIHDIYVVIFGDFGCELEDVRIYASFSSSRMVYTFCFLKSVQFSVELIMKPSNCDGAPIFNIFWVLCRFCDRRVD